MASKRGRVAALGIALLVILGGMAAYVFLYQGSVAVYVKDASGIWDHVYVTFSAVQIHESGKDNATWATVTSTQQTVDLAALTNVSQILGSVRLNPGHYEQIRLVVVNVTGVDTSGTHWNITVVNTTLKIVQQFSVDSGKTTTITVDIDLSRSIVFDGSGYKFTPVIGATVG